ncbi:MAG TPA: SusD/RagB family nutrient-binding outer membrane lipoprotein, partial [Daejeonella sp.]
MWVALFGYMNNIESFSNWRRTGYPVLVPVNYPGNETGGIIQRRLRYPAAEQSINTENYNAAIANQGPDTFLTRIWWDK